MKQPEDLKIGRVYFEFLHEDDRLRYPKIYSYEYNGKSDSKPTTYRFRILGTRDVLFRDEYDLEFIEDADELVASLNEWARNNPDLVP
jgi:hypothetical protein